MSFENEKIIETKKCKYCNESFSITDKDLEFYKKISPIFEWKKYIIPSPKLCPNCRQMRRWSFRNERKLYKRKCDLTGKEIISIYSPDKLYKVYDQKEWWSDKWDPMDYGKEFDFGRSFFEQFHLLFKEVPVFSIFNKNNENSEYSHLESDQKNCYMTTWGHWCEDVMYIVFWVKTHLSIDGFWVFDSSNSYELLNCYNVYKSMYLEYSDDCSDCCFWYHLKWCSYCIGCVNLENKKYCIFNKQYSKEEFEQKKKWLNLASYNSLKILATQFDVLKNKEKSIWSNHINTENSTGKDLYDSKNISNGLLITESKDCKNVWVFWWWSDTMDVDFWGAMELGYELVSSGMKSYKIAFNSLSYENNDIYYCMHCFNSAYLFGCVWLRNKQYCIFNKQYTKADYERIVPKIIEHMKKNWEWWEFFPSYISPFWYNETVADEFCPLKKEDALEKGFNWSDYKTPVPNVKKIISATKLPDTITDIPDDILNWAIECEVTKKPFRIIKPELDFYRKHEIPIPRKHPEVRYLERVKKGGYVV